MASPAVVEHFYIINDIVPSCLLGGVESIIYTLSFQASKEAFSYAVVPTISFVAHTANYFVFFEKLLKIITSILTSTI